jgi:site-specific recombinase XerD
MRLNALYNIVFNRKNVILNPGDTSLLQVEVRPVHDKIKYIGTGIYIEKKQWDNEHRIIVNHETAALLNQRIRDFISALQKFEISIINQGRMMTRKDIDAYLGKTVNKDQSFIAYMKDQANQRNDIVAVVRQKHLKVAGELEKNGIKFFSDLTFSNIQKYDRWLRDQGKMQTTIHKRHCVVKVYIHMSEKAGIIAYGVNPYLNFSVSRGKHKIRERLDDQEIKTLTSKVFDDQELSFARDLYVFQIYTGVAYKDLRVLSWSKNIRNNEGGIWIEGLRKKNGEYYSIFMIPESVEIMNRYKGPDLLFNAPDIWVQNRLMETISKVVGIKKSLSSHTARHTAATLMVRKGLPIEYIRDILGHTSTQTTEIYARIEKQGIREQMMKITKKEADDNAPPAPGQ